MCAVIFSIIKLFPPAKKHSQVVEIMRSVQDLTRPLPGCSGCWLSEEESVDSHIRYAEQWDSEEAMHAHIRSGVYRRLLAAMEISKQPPEVKFYYTSEEKGLELVESLRRLDPASTPHLPQVKMH